MFSDIKELSQHVDVINGLDSTKFRPLMSRIFERLTPDEDRIFTQEEEDKLMKVFNIPDQDVLDNLIHCLVSMARIAIYNLPEPKSLVTKLLNLGIVEEKAITFAQAWANSSSDKVNKLKQETFGLSANLLTDVNWKMRVQSNQNNASNLEKVKMQLDLMLSSNGGSEIKKHSLEFDSDQLNSFYKQLEEIQNQIDSKILQLPSS